MESEVYTGKNDFVDALRTQVNEETEISFPADEEILKHMDKTDKMYSFDMEDIDTKIKIERLTKQGEQLFLYRRKVNTKNIVGHCSIRAQYYIVNMSGEVVGRVPISISDPHSVSIDYWIKDAYQGRGLGTVVLDEVIKQIYSKKEFDNLQFSSVKYPDTKQTEIKSIGLEISDDNEASKRIASKNGFEKVRERAYALTREDYIARRQISTKDIAQAYQEMVLTSSEVSDAKKTMDRRVEKDTKNQEI